jgi:hypothetical protein
MDHTSFLHIATFDPSKSLSSLSSVTLFSGGRRKVVSLGDKSNSSTVLAVLSIVDSIVFPQTAAALLASDCASIGGDTDKAVVAGIFFNDDFSIGRHFSSSSLTT